MQSAEVDRSLTVAVLRQREKTVVSNVEKLPAV